MGIRTLKANETRAVDLLRCREMDKDSREPLSWEVKTAIGCLLLLSLQAAHEGALYCIGEPSPGHGKNHSAWAILLVIFFSIGLGLAYRSSAAWWFGLILVGGISFLYLGETWESIRWTLRPEYPTSGDMEIVSPVPRTLGRFEMLWLIVRNVLLVAVPSLLFLGEVRKLVGSPTP